MVSTLEQRHRRVLQQLLALLPPHSLTTIFCACQFLALEGIPQVLHKPNIKISGGLLGQGGEPIQLREVDSLLETGAD